ncbi:hypothetical protein D9M71_547590 [compost metagenome]
MLGGAKHHQLIFDPALNFQVGVVTIAFNQTQVNFVVGNLLHDISCVLHVEFDLALGMQLHETANQQGCQVVTDGQGCTDAQGTEAGFPIEQVFDFLRLIEQGHGLRQ